MMDDGVSAGGESWCAFLDGVRYCYASFMHLFILLFLIAEIPPTTDLLLFASPSHRFFLLDSYCWFYLFFVLCFRGDGAL